jgi:N-acetylglucosaminyldiphosphoundecaprenol N-acetyl-beta-D-mannosaminyltransferase
MLTTDQSRCILGMKVNATTYNDAMRKVLMWSTHRESRYVCVATVNNVMEAHDSTIFCHVMNCADLVTPDGMPLVWGLRLLGVEHATRVYGPNLMQVILEAATRERVPVGFYGSSSKVITRLVNVVERRFPGVVIGYSYSPPFRPLTVEEDQEVVNEINSSGTRILFVGLSSPKQDYWMAAHRASVQAVMVGVGAAFDFLAGTKPQAPVWMMRIGMEWFFRLLTEPRRLWKRYLKHNSRFIVLFAFQLLIAKKGNRR